MQRDDDQGDGDEKLILSVLRDDAGIVAGLEEQAAKCDAGHAIAAYFRAFHTLKGNAAVLGLASLEAYAAWVEERLQILRKITVLEPGHVSAEFASFLQAVTNGLKNILAAYRADTSSARAREPSYLDEIARIPIPADMGGTSQKLATPTKPVPNPVPSPFQDGESNFFLHATTQGKGIALPCDSILEILPASALLVAPQSRDDRQKGLLGLARCASGLVPIYQSGSLVEATGVSLNDPSWIVVVKSDAEGGSVPVAFGVAVDEIEGVREHLF